MELAMVFGMLGEGPLVKIWLKCEGIVGGI